MENILVYFKKLHNATPWQLLCIIIKKFIFTCLFWLKLASFKVYCYITSKLCVIKQKVTI